MTITSTQVQKKQTLFTSFQLKHFQNFYLLHNHAFFFSPWKKIIATKTARLQNLKWLSNLQANLRPQRFEEEKKFTYEVVRPTDASLSTSNQLLCRRIFHFPIYNVHFSKVKFANISSGVRDMILESNTFEKNSARRTFW